MEASRVLGGRSLAWPAAQLSEATRSITAGMKKDELMALGPVSLGKPSLWVRFCNWWNKRVTPQTLESRYAQQIDVAHERHLEATAPTSSETRLTPPENIQGIITDKNLMGALTNSQGLFDRVHSTASALYGRIAARPDVRAEGKDDKANAAKQFTALKRYLAQPKATILQDLENEITGQLRGENAQKMGEKNIKILAEIIYGALVSSTLSVVRVSLTAHHEELNKIELALGFTDSSRGADEQSELINKQLQSLTQRSTEIDRDPNLTSQEKNLLRERLKNLQQQFDSKSTEIDKASKKIATEYQKRAQLIIEDTKTDPRITIDRLRDLENEIDPDEDKNKPFMVKQHSSPVLALITGSRDVLKSSAKQLNALEEQIREIVANQSLTFEQKISSIKKLEPAFQEKLDPVSHGFAASIIQQQIQTLALEKQAAEAAIQSLFPTNGSTATVLEKLGEAGKLIKKLSTEGNTELVQLTQATALQAVRTKITQISAKGAKFGRSGKIEQLGQQAKQQLSLSEHDTKGLDELVKASSQTVSVKDKLMSFIRGK